jgi:putative ABC transport system substrate-binding protein
VETAARSLGIRLQHVEARGPEELDSAFAAVARERTEALLIIGSATFLVHRTRIAELAMKGRLPTMNTYREMVEAGGLMSYGINMTDFHRAAPQCTSTRSSRAQSPPTSPSSNRPSSSW